LNVDRLKELGRGTYTLIFTLNTDVEVIVGSLGRVAFRRGIYSYTGSALGPSKMSLYSRVKRHVSKIKRLRWHIDYLLTRHEFEVVAVIAASSDRRFECEVSRILSNVEGVMTYRRFGSSDCCCLGHLHYYADMELAEVLRLVSLAYKGLGLPFKVLWLSKLFS